jgi:putative pyruvate formate lyase activating enzyme
MRVAKIMLHHGEEPCISGKGGSGAIFFSGCALRCVFCQNAEISAGQKGKEFSASELEKEIYELVEAGADNINLVTAGHYLDELVPLLEKIKPTLSVPIVYNTGGYEKIEAIKRLDGLVDVYLPDYKYFSVELAQKYSKAVDYPMVAKAAIGEMLRQQPRCEFADDGMIKKGVIIRHLVLPSCRKDSIAVMRSIATDFKGAKISLMRQYTPKFNRSEFSELNRAVTAFEYDSVVNEANRLGLDGFIQEKGCETDEMTPDFSKVY